MANARHLVENLLSIVVKENASDLHITVGRNPTIRVEGNYDPDEWTGAAPWAVSAGGAIVPADWAKILIEAKVLGSAGEPVPGVYASLCVFRPEREEE